MRGNSHLRPIGRCSECGGVVSIPTVWHSVSRPVPSCEACGAVADETSHLPVIPTKPVKRDFVSRRQKPREEPERTIGFKCDSNTRRSSVYRIPRG
jgi:hypothetical protein